MRIGAGTSPGWTRSPARQNSHRLPRRIRPPALRARRADDRGQRGQRTARSRPRWSQRRSRRAARRLRRHGPSPSAHGSARPCPTSRPSRPTAQRRQGRRRSARSPPLCRAMAKKVVLGSRSASAPKISASGAQRSEICLDAGRAAPAPRRIAAERRAAPPGAAAPKPAIAGEVLGAGAVALFLAAAAHQRRRHHQVGLADDGAGALRSADLVRRQDQVIAHSRLKYRAEFVLPPAPHRRTSTPPAALTSAAISAIGWMTPVSLLAAWMATSGRPRAVMARRARRASAARSSTPFAVDRQQRSTAVRGETPARQQAGMIGRRDIEPRHATAPRAHPPVRRQQRRRRLGRAGGEDDMLRLGRDRAPRPRAAPASIMRARRAAFAMDRGRIGRRHQARQASPRAPRAAAARWHCSRDRRALPAIFRPMSASQSPMRDDMALFP